MAVRVLSLPFLYFSGPTVDVYTLFRNSRGPSRKVENQGDTPFGEVEIRGDPKNLRGFSDFLASVTLRGSCSAQAKGRGRRGWRDWFYLLCPRKEVTTAFI